MPDQSQCPVSTHSPFLLPNLQYTRLLVYLPFSQLLHSSLDSYKIKFYCNKSWQRFFPPPFSRIIAFPDTPYLIWPFLPITVVSPCAEHVGLPLITNCQLEVAAFLSYHYCQGSWRKTHGLDNAIGYYPVSAGRRGAAQDKLWQLDQKHRGLCAGQAPSVVQWHSLFKSTPAAVKRNITPPPSQAASTEPPKTQWENWIQELAV